MSLYKSIDHLEKLHAIAEANTLCFFYIDTSDGSMEFSERILDILDIQEPRFLNFKELYPFVVPEDIPALDALIDDFFSQKRHVAQLELRIAQKSSLPLWVRCSFNLLSDCVDGAVVVTIAGAFVDLSGEMSNRLIIDSCLDGTYVYDTREDASLFAGKIFDELLLKAGYYKKGRETLLDAIIPEDREYFVDFWDEVSNEKLVDIRIEFRMYGKNLQPVWVATRGKVFYDSENNPYMITGGLINIDELTVYNRFLKKEARTNAITQLPNKDEFIEDLSRILKIMDGKGYVFFVKVDLLNTASSAYNYLIENIFLKKISGILDGNKLFLGKLYHYDGDTFVIIAENITEDEAVSQMEYYKSITNMPFTYKNNSYPYALSMAGVAFPKFGYAPEIIIKNCNIALKKAKSTDKNKPVVFSDQLRETYNTKLELEIQLRNSVLNDDMKDFTIFYQPFVCTADHSCLGAEALLRWCSPKGEIISPLVFIPILEELGLMNAVGQWVFKTASLQCKKWLDHGFTPDFYISVNVSAPQLEDANFACNVLNYLEEIDLSPQNIVLELTESVLIADFQDGMTQLAGLKSNGLHLAIDDFGTGYSSLSYLRNLPVDEIKIDRSFISDIENDDFSMEFVSSIIKITKSMNRVVCVEGVETLSQSAILKELKADILQGFLFSRPILKEDFENMFFKRAINKLYWTPELQTTQP